MALRQHKIYRYIKNTHTHKPQKPFCLGKLLQAVSRLFSGRDGLRRQLLFLRIRVRLPIETTNPRAYLNTTENVGSLQLPYWRHCVKLLIKICSFTLTVQDMLLEARKTVWKGGKYVIWKYLQRAVHFPTDILRD